MAKHHGSGLIGLDVKSHSCGRMPQNTITKRWLLAMVIAVGVGMVILATLR